jgi:hypothetical protein
MGLRFPCSECGREWRSGEMDSCSTNVTVDIFYAKNRTKNTVYQ